VQLRFTCGNNNQHNSCRTQSFNTTNTMLQHPPLILKTYLPQMYLNIILPSPFPVFQVIVPQEVSLQKFHILQIQATYLANHSLTGFTTLSSLVTCINHTVTCQVISCMPIYCIFLRSICYHAHFVHVASNILLTKQKDVSYPHTSLAKLLLYMSIVTFRVMATSMGS